MKFIQFEESRPSQIRTMLEESPVAYVPVGALEWHAEHNPLGLDGLKAEGLCRTAAMKTGGVVFPTVYWESIHTMPFPFTFHAGKAGLRTLVRNLLLQLDSWGFEIIIVLTGHSPMTQINLLKKECRRFNRKGRAICIGAPEMVFAHDIGCFGDHAAMWETSFMLALRPELVDLQTIPAGLSVIERLEKWGIMGRDPVANASAEKGLAAVEHVASRIAAAVQATREQQTDHPFEHLQKQYEQATSLLSGDRKKIFREMLDVRDRGQLKSYLKVAFRIMLRSVRLS